MSALALALLLVVAPDSLEVAPCLGGTIVTRADLEAAGASHLRDAVRLASWDAVSVHGHDVIPTSRAGVPFSSSVRVLVDGAPVLRGGGIEPLGFEAVPVAFAEIERVVACPDDGIAGGAFGGPWIDIQTSAPAERAYGAAVLGNEAGDPGPYRYLDPSLPNVDRWGPDYEAGAVARTETATAWLTIRDQNFLPTDPEVFPRTVTATAPDYYPKRVGRTFAVAGRTRGLRVRSAVRRFNDLPFVPSIGRETPLTHYSAQTTVSGSRTSGAVRVWGHGHLGHVRLDDPPWGVLEVDPSWSELRADAALAVEVASGMQSVSGGGRFNVAGARAPGVDETIGVGRAWIRAASSRTRSGVSMTLAGTGSGGALGAAGQAEAWWRPSSMRVRASLSARRTLPEEILDADAWAGRGYALASSRTERSLDGPEDVARAQLVLDGRASQIAWAVGVEAQRSRAVSALEVEGSALSSWATARWLGRVLEVGAGVRAQGALDGTSAFFAAWDRVPATRTWLEARVRPDDRLALWARVEGVDGTDWIEGETPRYLLLDLGLSKRAWRDHLRLSLGGQNVLGSRERTHPLGATLGPRLFVRAQAQL